MTDRLRTDLLVSAMLRRANASGMGMVLAKGDATGGGVLVVIAGSGGRDRVVERGVGAGGRPALIDSTPPEDVTAYWQRRRDRDPDLWVVELIVPDAERLVVESLLLD